ncbi:phage terminase large subunit, partial [Enterobacter cloacae]|uniref:phage terminase large subunit n=1 Tax=Enterobacter cloacae TaxID=550 RepID=UPI0020032430
MTKLNPVFKPFIKPHRYKVAKGGRGSGKSWSIARLLVEISRRGTYRFLCAREFQASIADSVIQLIADTIEREGYNHEFEIQKVYIRHLATNSLFMFYGIKNNITKVKSLEGIDICQQRVKSDPLTATTNGLILIHLVYSGLASA